MAVVNRISEQEYRELALSEEGHLVELWDGVPREKPLMSMKHGDAVAHLGIDLANQLDRLEFRVNFNEGRARISERNYFIPDIAVIPAAFKAPYEDDSRALNAYDQPLPLVVEVWSRTTGHDDFAVKLQAYRERGDTEIWFFHPYERTLIAWRRQPDGSYVETLYRGGIVPVASLPGVVIDLDALLTG
ncbi:MAG: Uma2 family endonuclease [Thermomicrobiales bacterium]|nr:Uma2 family endonuclease [Thermomicrobiales bacterium]